LLAVLTHTSPGPPPGAWAVPLPDDVGLGDEVLGAAAAVGATTAAAVTAATANAYAAPTYNYYPPPYYRPAVIY